MPPWPISSRISKRDSSGGCCGPEEPPDRPIDGRDGGHEGGVNRVRSRSPHTGQVVTRLSGGDSNSCPLIQRNSVVMARSRCAARSSGAMFFYHSHPATDSHAEFLWRAGGVSPLSASGEWKRDPLRGFTPPARLQISAGAS